MFTDHMMLKRRIACFRSDTTTLHASAQASMSACSVGGNPCAGEITDGADEQKCAGTGIG